MPDTGYATGTRRDVRDLALCIGTVFALVVILCLVLSRTAWAS